MGLFVQQVINGLAIGAIYALLALGFTVLWNVGNVVNFAQGEFATLSMFFLFTFLIFLNLPLPLALILAIVAIALVGVLAEVSIIRPVIGADPHTIILMTIGLQILFANGAKLIWGTRPLYVEPYLAGKPLQLFGVLIKAQNLWILAIVLGLVAILTVFAARSKWGKAFRALTQDTDAAWLMGINVRVVRTVAFAVSAALAGVSGVLLAPIVYVSAELGLAMLIRAFAAAVIGGFGSYPGALVGGLLIGLIDTLGGVYVSSQYRDLITFGLLMLVLVIRPTGIFGAPVQAEQKA
jgi:branched-chain amino acid transport system permease protein